MKKMLIYFATMVLLVTFVSSCDPLISPNMNWPTIDSGEPYVGKPKSAIIPTGVKSFFAPTINAEILDASRRYNINNADSTQEQAGQLIPNIIYASFEDGSFREVMFESTTGQKLWVGVEDLENAGEGYLSATLGNIYPVIEVDDGNGGKKWISIYEDSSKYVRIRNTYFPEYCKVENYVFATDYCATRPIEIRSDGRQVLIDSRDGKIYDISWSVRESLEYHHSLVLILFDIEVVDNYAYCVKRGDWSLYDNYYYFKIDLRDMKAYQINVPWSHNFERGVIFDTGDIIASTYLKSYEIFSVNTAQYPYGLWLDNLSVYYDWKMPTGLSDVDLKDYRLGLRYGSSDAFTTFMNASRANQVAAVTNALAFSDVYTTDNYYYSDLSAYYGSTSRQYNHTYFRDSGNALYTLTLQKYFDTPAPAPTGRDPNRLDNMACKVTGGYSDYNYIYEACYKASSYLVLSKVFLKDHIIISREEVDKVRVDFSDGFKGVLVNGQGSNIADDYKAIRRLAVQRSFDNKSFYEVDMKTKKITKTSWNGADIFKDINAEKTIYYGNSGVAWVRENGAGVMFIPYKENASPANVVNDYIAGGISVDGDNIYYTARLSATTFKTKVKNMKTGEVKILSESPMITGNIIELAF